MPDSADTFSTNATSTASISRSIVQLFSKYVGRGPTKARTTVSGDVAVVVLGETMTMSERTLVDAGEGESIWLGRKSLCEAMRPEACATVEQVVGRSVVGYFTDIDLQADVAMLAFMLEPC